MRTTWLVALVLLAALPLVAVAQSGPGFGLNGIGLQLGVVSPEDDIKTTVIFSGHVDLGSPFVTVPNLTIVPSLSYWSSSFDDSAVDRDASEFGLNADVRYLFPSVDRWTFFAGGGLGLFFSSFDIAFISPTTGDVIDKDSDSSTDFGLTLLGGVKTAITPVFDGSAELRFKFDGLDTFQLLVGGTYRLLP